MKKRVISLIISILIVFSSVPATYADSIVYTKSDLQSLYDTVATYIFSNEEILKSSVTEEEDILCTTPILVAKKALLSDFPSEDYDAVYRGLYSSFSMLSLASQRNNYLNTPKVRRLLNALISLIVNDDFYKIAPVDLANETREVVAQSMEYIENPTKYATDDMHAQLSQLYITLHNAAEYKLNDFNAKYGAYAFEDVLLEDWYFSAVKYVYEEGLFKGTSISSFSPSSQMTRGMFITVLSRFAGISDTSYLPAYSDVDPDVYYALPIYWANDCGLVPWVDGDIFQPDKPITREEMVTTMYNYLIYIGYDLSSVVPSPLENFPDISEASDFAPEAIGYTHAMGIINGYEDGSLKPLGTATRAEVAKVFINFENAIK